MQIAQTPLDPLPVSASWDTLETDAYVQVCITPDLIRLFVGCLVCLLKLLVL